MTVFCVRTTLVTAAKDILCQFNWPKGSVPHAFNLLPTLSSVEELLRVTRQTDTTSSDRALREEESNAMDTSVHNPSHKHSNIVQGTLLCRMSMPLIWPSLFTDIVYYLDALSLNSIPAMEKTSFILYYCT